MKVFAENDGLAPLKYDGDALREFLRRRCPALAVALLFEIEV